MAGNMGNLEKKVLGMKMLSKLERGGEGNLRNKRYREGDGVTWRQLGYRQSYISL